MSPRIISSSPKTKHLSAYQDVAENDDLCVKPIFFHRASITSTYDSAESIATPPPESYLDDEQTRALLASPLYLQERADRSQDYHSERELDVQFISGSDKYGRPGALLFSSKNRFNPETFFDREDLSLRHLQFWGNNDPLVFFL